MASTMASVNSRSGSPVHVHSAGVAAGVWLALFAVVLPASAAATWSLPPSTRGSAEGTAIARRLNAARDAVTYSTSGAGPRPQAAFCTYPTYMANGAAHVFVFCVSVFANHASAETDYNHDLAFVEEYGTLAANQLDVVGSVSFWGYTGGQLPTGSSGPPPLPRASFLAVVETALGRG